MKVHYLMAKAQLFTPQERSLASKLATKIGREDLVKTLTVVLNTNKRRVVSNLRSLDNVDSNSELFSPEEEELFNAKFQELGANWGKLKSFFPNRTENQLKNHFYKGEKVVEDCIPYPYNSQEINISENMNLFPVTGTETHSRTYENDSQVGQFNNNSMNYSLTNYPVSQLNNERYKGNLLSGEEVNMEKRIGDLTFIREIGKGSCASVALTQKDGMQTPLVSKIMPIEFLVRNGYEDIQYRENGFLNFVENENIIHLYGSFKSPDGKYAISLLEYCTTDLFHLIFSKKISPEEKKRLAHQIILSVCYLHHNSIAHRDLKPENFLVKDGKILLSDFGFAHFCTPSPITTDRKASLAFAAPEFFTNREVNSLQMDIYAIGLTLWLLATGDKSFYQIRDRNLIEMRALYFEFPIDESDELQVLAKWCLMKNPDDRPTIDQLLSHHYFKGL